MPETRLVSLYRVVVCLLGTAVLLGTTTEVPAGAAMVDVVPLARSIRAIGPHGKGQEAAAGAWKVLVQADVTQLPQILSEMQGANLLATNWLRAAVETIAQRQVKGGGRLPVESLEAFLMDTRQSPRARRLAYELILKVDSAAERRLIPRLANDPSVELRRDAVALLLREAAAAGESPKDKEATIAAYRRAFEAARDADQIKEAVEKLTELGSPPDVATHYGFLMSWKLIGPFDNTDKGGFDVAYPPESTIDLTATYQGKGVQVRWIDHVTVDAHGQVDLNKAIGKHMGAIAYAVAEFHSAVDRDVELRLGCTNGNKIWLNGTLLTANHVYHTGAQIDQYIAPGRLKKGRNTILLKIAQNEQKDDWAQNWQFQLRVCDGVGTAVLSSDRSPATSQASGR